MNNKIKKNMLTFTVALLFLVVALFCTYRYQESVKKEKAIEEQKAIENAVIEKEIKEKAISNAKNYGYTIEFTDEKTFCMKKDEVKYSFCIDTSGVRFDYCEFYVEEENVNVKEGDVILKIKDIGNDEIEVRYDDTRIVILDDGTEELMFSGADFVSNLDFDKESLIIDPNKIDDKQKSLDAYTWIMKFVTVDDLKEHYNKALAICNQLNE